MANKKMVNKLKHVSLKSVLCSLCLLLSTHLLAADIIIAPDMSKLPLDSSLNYLYDQQQTYQITEIADPEFDRQLPWQSGQQRVQRSVITPGLYWFKGRLVNNHEQAITLTLQVEYPSINIADLYVIDEADTISTVYANAGLDSAFTNRPIHHRNLVNNLTIPANSSVTVIWRIESEPLFQFRATAWAPEVFLDRNQHSLILYGMMYGVLIVMALYNLFLYVSTRHKSYIYYVLYVATSGYLIAADQGHMYQYLATGEAWPKLFVYTFMFISTVLMFAQFSIHFLNLKYHSTRLLLTIRSLAVISALCIVALVLSNNEIIAFVGLAAISLLFLCALIAGVLVRKAGVISAGHFVIAIMILMFSLAANNMATLGLIQSNELTEGLGAIGTILMLIFFALALADRINQLQKDSNDAIQAMAKANEEKIKTHNALLKSQMERIKLEQSASQARQESRSKSRFLATLSHEIRTPMGGILGMNELLRSTQLDEQQSHYLNSIEHSGQSLLAIINDLQDFAKIEAGQMELAMSSFNLETLLDDCISTFSLRSQEKNLNFIADLDPTIDPVLVGDATKLRQIILNLLSNAFKFTDQGDVLLTVSTTGKPAINSTELRFEVKDSGIGLTPDEQRRLFAPFQHADESTYGQYGGSGLGLAISKQLAELMDGEIGVESEPGNGSLFWFTARLIIDEQPEPSLLREKSSKLDGQRILLVEPNPVSLDIIHRLLRSWKLDVEAANTVRDAIDRINSAAQQNNPFNLVLSEYHLDNGDCLPLAQHIQQLSQYPPVFILMAASRNINKRSELSDYGIEILLEKPITNALLHDVLIRAIAAPKSTHSLIDKLEVDTSTLKVLVVEDNQVNQLVIQGLLKKLGVKSDLATNGLVAIQRAEKQHYDLILMDCEMPEMDGYEATRQLRNKEQHNNRPRSQIIALSAHARSDHRKKALKAGMDNYLTKPITLSELLQVINQLKTD